MNKLGLWFWSNLNGEMCMFGPELDLYPKLYQMVVKVFVKEIVPFFFGKGAKGM